MSETVSQPLDFGVVDPLAEPAIELNSLRKVYGNKVAVDDLTLSVDYGEVFGFLGPNGAGKTTSIKMLMGLVYPTSGRARLLGRPLGDRQSRRQIGFLPELFRFHEWLTGAEFLDLHGQLYGMSRAARAKRIPDVLALVDLSTEGHKKIRTYSKGMQQRIGLAQSLLNNPRLVFLDEPTSALDPLGRRDVRAILSRLHSEGVTVFLNSHLLSEVEMSSDRVAIIDHGRVVAVGRVEDLLARDLTVEFRLGPVTPETTAELGKLLQIEQVISGPHTVITARAPSEELVAQAVDLLSRHRVPVYGVMPERRSLEDVFVDVVSPVREPGR
jgi:ABC-2 type transport system ATP-binding protein